MTQEEESITTPIAGPTDQHHSNSADTQGTQGAHQSAECLRIPNSLPGSGSGVHVDKFLMIQHLVRCQDVLSAFTASDAHVAVFEMGVDSLLIYVCEAARKLFGESEAVPERMALERLLNDAESPYYFADTPEDKRQLDDLLTAIYSDDESDLSPDYVMRDVLPRLAIRGKLSHVVARLNKSKCVIASGELAYVIDDLKKAIDVAESWTGHKSAPEPVRAAEILATPIKPGLVIIAGVLVQGLVVLAGKAKVGKSWLVLQWCLLVAGARLSGNFNPGLFGNVLYLALEDSVSRIKSRLRKMLGDVPCPESLDIVTSSQGWPQLDAGGLDGLVAYLDRKPETVLIVIDVLAKVKPKGKGRENAYESDYRILTPLQELAAARQIAIVVVHHMRKEVTADEHDAVSGSAGITACADSILLMKRAERSANDAELSISGRDVESQDQSLRWDSGASIWHRCGKASERLTEEREEILDIIRKNGPMNAKEVASTLSLSYDATRRTTSRMCGAGQLVRRHSRYEIPDVSSTPCPTRPTGPIDTVADPTHPISGETNGTYERGGIEPSLPGKSLMTTAVNWAGACGRLPGDDDEDPYDDLSPADYAAAEADRRAAAEVFTDDEPRECEPVALWWEPMPAGLDNGKEGGAPGTNTLSG